MADIVTLTAEGRFREAGLTAGIKSATKAVYELDTSLSALQNTMKNVTLAPAMQKVVANFKSAISQIKDGNPIKMMDAWKQANKELQDITGVQTMKNAWELLENATTPEKIMSSFNALGNEYKRLASEAEASAKKQQAALKEMYDSALQKYDKSNAIETAKATEDIDRSMRGADTSISEADKSMQSLGNTTTKTNGIFKNFIGSLTRIAKLRLLRGIIRAVTQAFKEGTENIYQYSAAMGSADASHFKSTMDGLASSFLYLKNSIGSVVAPLLASLVPALQTVIGWVSAALNVLAQFFAVLNGQSTYTRAKQTATEWKNIGAAAGGAAAAAQEYKNTIMSFDEIHALNDPSSGGGGGGGGAGSPDFSDMFEEAELATSGIAGAFNKLATALKPIIGGIWDFTKNTVETVFEGLGLGFDALMAVIHGNKNEIIKVIDDIGKFVSKHPVLKHIYDGINAVRKFINNVISEVSLWLLDLFENFINLPFVSTVLGVLGIDVDNLTRKIELQKKGIQDQREEVSRNIRGWNYWADGVDTATTNMMLNIQDAGRESIKAFAGIQSAADLTRNSVKNVSGAVVDLNRSIASLGGMSINQWVENGLWGIYRSANAAKWELFGVLDYVRELSRASLNGIAIAVYGGIGRAGGGFVNGYANGGIIPAYANGTINTADVFMANENGSPELIGRIGNRTAVANQGQMVDAMAQGVYQAMMSVQGNQQSNLEVNVMMDREVLAKAVDRGNRSLNRRYNVSLA